MLDQACAHCPIFPTAASRRSLGRVSVPVWLIVLSDQLPIAALVGHYPTNKLIGRRLLQRRLSALTHRPHAVLAPVSRRCPPPLDRFLRVPHPSAAAGLPRPRDLHVLSMPPAFALSQDQTLRFIEAPLAPQLPPRGQQRRWARSHSTKTNSNRRTNHPDTTHDAGATTGRPREPTKTARPRAPTAHPTRHPPARPKPNPRTASGDPARTARKPARTASARASQKTDSTVKQRRRRSTEARAPGRSEDRLRRPNLPPGRRLSLAGPLRSVKRFFRKIQRRTRATAPKPPPNHPGQPEAPI